MTIIPTAFIFKGTNRVTFNSAGWINATSAAKVTQHNPKDWVTGYDGMQILEALSGELGIRYPQGFFERKGIFTKNPNLLRVLIDDQRIVRSVAGDPENGGGIWLHPALVLPFARWISADFALWCETITESLKADAEQASQRASNLTEEHDGMATVLDADQLAEYRLAAKVLKDCGADAQERRSILAARFGGDPSQTAKQYSAADAELNARGLDSSERQEILATRFKSLNGGALS